MSQGRLFAAIGAFALVTIVLVALLYQGGTPDPVDPAEIPEPTPVPTAVDRPQPEPVPVPVPTPTPSAEPAPEVPDDPGPVPEQARLDYNYAVDDAIAEARAVCLDPWVQREAGGAVTFVMDAVVRGGEVSEITVRGAGAQVPGDVIDCARDAAWNIEWPAFEYRGEIRFQRSFTSAPE